MNVWLTLIRDLFRFRRGPADVPYVPSLLFALFVAMIMIDAGAARALTGQNGNPMLAAANNGVALLLIHVLLKISGKPARFMQTATALLLVRVALSLLTLLLMSAVLPIPKDPEDLQPLQALLMALMLPLLIWYMALRVHILRHALEVVWPRALGLVLLIAAAEFVIALLFVQAFR
ncbi:MAG TPA: hypothetical protein PLQ74_11285 [Pseudomonadota bacterium]|nr:hypothetical protein [Xanthomonadales bacterium]HQW82439.1 hypothetical protein [Pseudomonadota bacterium]